MTEPIRVLEQQDLSGKLDELLEALHALVQNYEKINADFHEYLAKDPEMKERYRAFVSEYAETEWAKNELALLTEPEKEESEMQMQEEEKQIPKKEEGKRR